MFDLAHDKNMEEYSNISFKLRECGYFEENRVLRRIVEDNIDLPIEELFYYIETVYPCYISKLFFPRDVYCFYYRLKESKSKNIITCDVSGSIINRGDVYISYRPLIENVSKNQVYVLKRTIKIASAYVEFLPKNFFEFEELERKLTYPKALADSNFDYFDLSKKIGEGLVLKKTK